MVVLNILCPDVDFLPCFLRRLFGTASSTAKRMKEHVALLLSGRSIHDRTPPKLPGHMGSAVSERRHDPAPQSFVSRSLEGLETDLCTRVGFRRALSLKRLADVRAMFVCLCVSLPRRPSPSWCRVSAEPGQASRHGYPCV